MTKLEDRLRSDLRAMAQQAQPEALRPLRRAGRADRPGGQVPGGWRRPP